MKNISVAFRKHLEQEVTSLATCWRAVLRDGALFAFTDHTRDLHLDDGIYSCASGYIPSAVEASSLLNVDNLEVEAILNNDMISEADLQSGRWDYASVQIFVVNYEDLSMGRMILKTGTLGQITMKQNSFVAEIRGLTQAYTNVIGEVFTPMCRAQLGDNRCKINLDTLILYLPTPLGGAMALPAKNTGTVQGISADGRFISDANRTEPGPEGGIPIVSISRAERAVVTLAGPHTYGYGESIFITGVNGMVQTGSGDPTKNDEFQYGSGRSINGYSYVIADVTPTSFSIPLDTRLGSSTAADGPPYSDVYSAYISGGAAYPADATGFYDYGTLTFGGSIGGNNKNAGLSMEIKSYIPGVIELQMPMPYPVQVGDPYTITVGCGKRFVEDCKNKFNNVVNFRGEPHLPGLDKTLVSGSHSQQYRTTPSVTTGTSTPVNDGGGYVWPGYAD